MIDKLYILYSIFGLCNTLNFYIFSFFKLLQIVVFQVRERERERAVEELVNWKLLYPVSTQLEFWVKEDLGKWYWPKRKHLTDLTNFLPLRC